MIKIALVGKKATGKTFVAHYLSLEYGYKKMRISDGVTKLMRYMYKYGPKQRVSWERKLDIYDALYKIDPTIHLNYLLRRLKTTTNNVVVDDVRYVSELLRLKEEGFTIIRVVAPENRRTAKINALRKAGGGTLVIQEHFNQDKTTSYSADFSIFNDTRDGTRKSVDQIISKLVDIEVKEPV